MPDPTALPLESSTNLSLDLPNATIGASRLKDVQRIKTALLQIDTIVSSLPTTSDVVSPATFNASISNTVDTIRGGVTADADTLQKVKAFIDSIDSDLTSLTTTLTNTTSTANTANTATNSLQTAVDNLESTVAAIQTTLSSNDTTLDTIQELVNQIKSNTNTLGTLAALSGSTNSVTQVMTNKTVDAGVFTGGYTEEYSSNNTGANYTINLANGSFQEIVLTANTTLVFPSAATPGMSFTLMVKQDATGNRTITWPSNIAWPSSTIPTITATPNKKDKLIFSSDGVNWLGSVAGQNY